MKANWKLALMCLATLTMVACGDKNPAEAGGGGGGGIPEGYVPPISVDDKSFVFHLIALLFSFLQFEYKRSQPSDEAAAS